MAVGVRIGSARMSPGRVATGSASSWNGLRVGHVALLCEEVKGLPANGEAKDESEDATVLAGEGKAGKSAGGCLLFWAM